MHFGSLLEKANDRLIIDIVMVTKRRPRPQVSSPVALVCIPNQSNRSELTASAGSRLLTRMECDFPHCMHITLQCVHTRGGTTAEVSVFTFKQCKAGQSPAAVLYEGAIWTQVNIASFTRSTFCLHMAVNIENRSDLQLVENYFTILGKAGCKNSSFQGRSGLHNIRKMCNKPSACWMLWWRYGSG